MEIKHRFYALALWLTVVGGLQAQALKPAALSGTASGELTVAIAQTPLYMEASTNSPIIGQCEAKAKLALTGFAIDTMAMRSNSKEAALAEGLFFKVNMGDIAGYVPRWYLSSDESLNKVLRQIYPNAPAPAKVEPAPAKTDTKGGKGSKKGK